MIESIIMRYKCPILKAFINIQIKGKIQVDADNEKLYVEFTCLCDQEHAVIIGDC